MLLKKDGLKMIKEPQKSYLLELLIELGELANDFVLAGGQAMHFMVDKVRPTKDFDFVLDVYSLRARSQKVADILSRLGYEVDPKAMNFQFSKKIPNSNEIMRIEFLGCGKDEDTENIRIKIQDGLHARDCHGAAIVLKESVSQVIKGNLPNGAEAEAKIRVVLPQALLMLKLLAMDDRYNNIRGPKEVKHDREEAIIHAGDVINIIRSNITKEEFSMLFWRQFGAYGELRERSKDILQKYFANIDSPGMQLYREHIHTENLAADKNEEEVLLNRAVREANIIIAAHLKE
jgi:hypothetical protein